MERDCESELSKLNIEQNACIYHFGASVIHGQRSNILRLRLAEVHPELVSEWSEKNLTLTPDDITFGSNKKVWWRGACGHEWQTSVKARSNGEKCPICSGARVIAGINDLATLEPLLVKQWSKKNKIKPTEVSIGSHSIRE